MKTLKDYWPDYPGRGEQPKHNDLFWHVRPASRDGFYWLWPDLDSLPAHNAGDYIHWGSPTIAGKGYAGRHLPFQLLPGCDLCRFAFPQHLLEDGNVILKGPFHSNSDSFYEDTGVDFRDRYLTRGIILKDSTYVYRDIHEACPIDDAVLHIDNSWTLGHFHRIEMLAKQIANHRKEPVYIYTQSMGGASAHQVKPEEDHRGLNS